MTKVRVRVCASSELVNDEVVAVAIPKGPDNRPREALVLRGHDGLPRAYINRCRHLPIPIDAGSREYLTPDRQHLLCGTHGALYRRDDGICIAGPCLYLALEKLAIDEEDGVLYVLV